MLDRDSNFVLRIKPGSIAIDATGTAFIVKEVINMDNIILETLYQVPITRITRDVDCLYESFRLYESELQYILYHKVPKGRTVTPRRVTKLGTKSPKGSL